MTLTRGFKVTVEEKILDARSRGFKTPAEIAQAIGANRKNVENRISLLRAKRLWDEPHMRKGPAPRLARSSNPHANRMPEESAEEWAQHCRYRGRKHGLAGVPAKLVPEVAALLGMAA
jgi:hypothetical protein